MDPVEGLGWGFTLPQAVLKLSLQHYLQVLLAPSPPPLSPGVSRGFPPGVCLFLAFTRCLCYLRLFLFLRVCMQ